MAKASALPERIENFNSPTCEIVLPPERLPLACPETRRTKPTVFNCTFVGFKSTLADELQLGRKFKTKKDFLLSLP